MAFLVFSIQERVFYRKSLLSVVSYLAHFLQPEIIVKTTHPTATPTMPDA